MPPDVIITPTTHWDREWVQTQIQYQVRLVQLIDRLMDILDGDPAFTCFMFDGQTAPFEDYLQIKPENRDRLCRLIRAGRIIIGPWYVLADQFMQDGESTIRNLIVGRRQCLELGAEPMGVCYVPDSFGCIDSMPMFAAGFGLRHAMFGRGRPTDLPTDKKCFNWVAPDGSSVLAANHGYGSGLFLSYPDIWTNIDQALPDKDAALAQMKGMLNGILGGENAPVTHLSAGADHMEARAGLREVVEHLNKHIKEATFRIDGPSAYFDAVEKAKPALVNYSGEFRGPDVKMFNGCTSSHIRLKQANFKAQRWLSAYLEPLSVFAEQFGHEYPRGFIDQLWKLVLINHPHDSICGCSIDRVHDDMANRYARIYDAATMLTERATRAIVPHIATGEPATAGGAVVVFNTLAHARGGVINQWVRIPHRLADGPLTLVDSDGKEQPGQISVVAEKQMDLESLPMTTHQLGTVISKNAAPNRKPDDVFTVIAIDATVDTIPALGYRTMHVVPKASIKRPLRKTIRKTKHGMTNGIIALTFNADGTFDLDDMRSGQKLPALHHFEDTEDIGDAYGHRHYDKPDLRTTRGSKAKLKCIAALPNRVTWRVTMPWKLPLSSAINGRSSTLADATLTSDVTLHAGSDRVEIVTTTTNIARDHRLRAVFETTLAATHSVAEGNYSRVRRAITDPESSMEGHPQQGFVEIADDTGNGFALLNRGLPEFEAVKLPSKSSKEGDISRQDAKTPSEVISLRLTLLRCTGELGPPAGANHPTPGAQDPGDHRFEYAIRPLSSGESVTERVAAVRDYTVPLTAEGATLHKGTLPSEGSFLRLEGSAILGALKQAERSTDTILRLWNPADQPSDIRLAGIQSAAITNLNEDHLSSCQTNEPSAHAPVPAKGLVSVSTPR